MRNLKRILQDKRRSLYELFGNPKYSKPSLNNLDDKLSKYLDFRNGFFIEVGANDGYSQSNTYYLEKMLGWHGVLIEGIPELYQRCKQLRSNSLVYNCALVANNYTEATIEMHFANLMSLVSGSRKSTEAESQHITDGLKVQNLTQSYTVKVPARTLESILDELPSPVKIDFLSLDVEGYELNVLQGLNLEKYKPRYILVEVTFWQEINELLQGMYDLVEKMSYHDYLYKLK